MSYPPPPGLKASQSSSGPSSLPPRPPPPPPTAGAGRGHGTSSIMAFAPRAVAAQAPASRPNVPASYSAGMAGAGIGPATPYQAQPQPQPVGPSYYPQPQASAGYDAGAASYAAPQIRNPFVAPNSATAAAAAARGFTNYDPEMEAQIAQWQSAYGGGKDDTASRRGATNANLTPLGGGASGSGAGAAGGGGGTAAAAGGAAGGAGGNAGAAGQQRTVLRTGGGQTWQDSTLLEWDPAHFRIFVGNLAGEVTDDSLLKAFAKFPSVQRARVVRDKRTTKSKGYGFVSFADGDDYFQAAREMQGKYIGSHPVLIKKAVTDVKAVAPRDAAKAAKSNKGGGRGHGGGSGHTSSTGAGVHKKSSKTKGGLKILG